MRNISDLIRPAGHCFRLLWMMRQEWEVREEDQSGASGEGMSSRRSVTMPQQGVNLALCKLSMTFEVLGTGRGLCSCLYYYFPVHSTNTMLSPHPDELDRAKAQRKHTHLSTLSTSSALHRNVPPAFHPHVSPPVLNLII